MYQIIIGVILGTIIGWFTVFLFGYYGVTMADILMEGNKLTDMYMSAVGMIGIALVSIGVLIFVVNKFFKKHIPSGYIIICCGVTVLLLPRMVTDLLR